MKSALAALLAAVALFMTGCPLLESDSSGSLTFRVTGEMAAKIAGEASARSARSLSAEDVSTGSTTEDLYFDIALKGGYSASQTLPVTDGATATFDDIPVGTELWAEGIAYRIEEIDGTQTKIVLYTGKSDRVMIKDGENTLSLVMKKAETEDVLVKIYISATGSDENEGTAASPLATIAGAVAKMTDATQEYTIIVCGEVSGASVIPDTLSDDSTSETATAFAKSVRITGSDNSAILNGGFTESSKGTTLTVKTKVPVIIGNIQIKGGYAENGGGLYIDSDAIVTLYEGTISLNTAGSGAGVYNKGTFTMSGGSIAGNKATSGTGGGVYNAGKFFMYGAAVIGDASATTAATADAYSNYASSGGAGLYNASGAVAYLGYSDESTKATLTGGICYNYKGDGAGINNQGTVKMASGSVSYNGHDGYAVGVLNNATFELSGGKVCGNAYSGSSGYGGGFRNENGTLTMTGGEISGNSSTNGGGVMVRLGTFKMTGGSITGNSATTGKSIYYEDGTVSVTGITVNKNSGYDENISL